MAHKKTKTSEKLFLEFQQKELKVELEDYKPIFANGGTSPYGSGSAPGVLKITGVTVSVDEKNTPLLMTLIAKGGGQHSPLDGYFSEVSILKNTKKVANLSKCLVMFLSANPYKENPNIVKIEFKDGTFTF